MSTTTFSSGKPADANTYWNMLKDLSMDVKLDLIAKLSNSLRNKGSVADDTHWASEFAGKWKDSRSTEEIIDDIRQARTTNREIDL